MLAPASVRSRKIDNGRIGWATRVSITTNATSRIADAANSPIVRADSHECVVVPTSPYTSSTSPSVTVTRAADVEAALVALDTALLQQHRREREHDHADRDVDEEDPLPADRVREHATEEHAYRGAAPGDRAPHAERGVALLAFGERRRQDREGRRRDDRRTETLHGARSDERSRRVRESARERRGREHDQPDHEDPPPTEQVGDTPTEQEEPAERQRVRAGDPLQP